MPKEGVRVYKSKWENSPFGFFSGSNVAEPAMDTKDDFGEILATAKPKKDHTPIADERGCLFTVTTIARDERFGGTRTPVVCSSFARAKEIVEKNEGDIWEYSYMLCVIEGIIPDQLYSSAGGPQFWYMWDLKKERYVPIETPEAYKNQFGFGVG